MDQSNFMMALLIPGKYSPGKDFHVFMQPLIADMQKLWHGVETNDVCTGEPFNLRAMLIWSIHDYPAYGTTSGRSTMCYYACVHCDENPCFEKLKNKIGYISHRRFLHKSHHFRRQKHKEEFVEWFEDHVRKLRNEPKDLTLYQEGQTSVYVHGMPALSMVLGSVP
jgi:hypothetical protein